MYFEREVRCSSVCSAVPYRLQIDDEKWMGVLFGLGGHASITGAASYQVPPSGAAGTTADAPNGNGKTS
jgi:hypothetical protein